MQTIIAGGNILPWYKMWERVSHTNNNSFSDLKLV